jgi:hypothetical protein
MSWPLNDQLAIDLATSLYKEFFKGVELEIALFRPRKKIQGTKPNDCTWLSPVMVVQG